ncbi:ERF family protein [Marinobacter sp.]|uniref:ERF family protein n=1 Tax=Marinobacter sp. TaxID=50741 RepID=UPI000C95AFC0|nr:ERF family protein [Marinobacter sp.]MAB53498.1 hypothetical protein [Marinobacter sp.]QDP47727.1 MAG: putative essential recombination function protein [Prokaryotic dsDNA virus sp.]|tara:strand:+ start:26529 stop:26999 length:471 start_codon:yes stop_codon:yes gene_type:complete
MEQTTSEIAKAFVAAQKQFEKTGLDSKNPHFRNDYASLAACIGAVKEALNENGIALVQKTHECDKGIKIESIFLHESGQTISGGILILPAEAETPQKYGSALTYARRYSLLAACGIPPEDKLDDDAEIIEADERKKEEEQQKKETRTPPPAKKSGA